MKIFSNIKRKMFKIFKSKSLGSARRPHYLMLFVCVVGPEIGCIVELAALESKTCSIDQKRWISLYVFTCIRSLTEYCDV